MSKTDHYKEICVKDLKLLEENQLIEKTASSTLIPTRKIKIAFIIWLIEGTKLGY